MKYFLYVLYWIIQWTWGFPQTFMGLIYSLMQGKTRHEFYHGAVVTYHNGNWGGISLGMFTIVNGHRPPIWTKYARVHEYGHTIQSLMLGPLYLFVIGLPSVIWAYSKKFVERREKGLATYYDFYPESGANTLGALVTKDEKPNWDKQMAEKKQYNY